MKVARFTIFVFAALLLATIANAQYSTPGYGYGNGYGGYGFGYGGGYPGQMPGQVPGQVPGQFPGQIIPVPNGSQNYFSIPQMYMPQSSLPSFTPGSVGLPSYQNFQNAPYSEFGPQFAPSFNPSGLPDPFQNDFGFSNNYRSSEDEQERREKEEEREEARQDREEKREQEREDRRREQREEREAERRGDSRKDSKDVNNWPPVPKSSDKAKLVPAQDASSWDKAHSTASKAADGKATTAAPPAKPATATTRSQTPPQAQSAVQNSGAATRASDAKPQPQTQIPPRAQPPAKPQVSAQASTQPANPAKHWWDSSPEYQKFLSQQKAATQSAPAWPPKTKPVTSAPAPQKEIQSTTGKLAASTTEADCQTCKANKGALSQQIEQMQTLANPREVFILTRPPSSKVSEGIKRVMNTMYQSCEAYSTLLRPDYCQDGFVGKGYCEKQAPRKAGDLTAYHDPKQFFSYELASQPGSNVMTPAKPEGPQCRDMNKTPPVFKVGGRPTLSADHKTLNLWNNGKNGTKFVTMDCSGFVSATYEAAGLNFVPNNPGMQATTATLRSQTPACLNTVSFTPQKSIESGDVAVFAGESQHSMIFDRVGSDPFGLQTITAQKEANQSWPDFCLANLKPSQFDFVIAQSGVYGGRVAISQARAVDYIVNFGAGYDVDGNPVEFWGMDNINAQIIQIAIDACVAKFSGKPVVVNKPDGAKLVRHKGTAAAGCVRPTPPAIVGESCVKDCR